MNVNLPRNLRGVGAQKHPQNPEIKNILIYLVYLVWRSWNFLVHCLKLVKPQELSLIQALIDVLLIFYGSQHEAALCRLLFLSLTSVPPCLQLWTKLISFVKFLSLTLRQLWLAIIWGERGGISNPINFKMNGRPFGVQNFSKHSLGDPTLYWWGKLITCNCEIWY